MKASYPTAIVAALWSCIAVASSIDGSAAGRNPLFIVEQQRGTIVQRIVGEWSETLVGLPGNRASTAAELSAKLWRLRADRLLGASLAGSYAAIEAILADEDVERSGAPKTVTKLLGDANADLTYTPVSPCRIADTRGAGGALAGNTARTFDGYAASSFASQGGTASNCGMPNGVAAIAMNVYAVNPTNLGFIKVWPANGTEPAVSTVNYQVGIAAIATGAIVPVDGANNNRFSAKSPAQVDFIADVVGYFRAPGGALEQRVAALESKVAKLDGQITAADLVGTYLLRRKQTELQGGSNSTRVSSYVFQATIQLAANGTFQITATPENGNTLQFFTAPPSVVNFAGDPGGSGPGTWSYSNGALTLDGIVTLDVVAGGKVLFGVVYSHADGTDVLLIGGRL